MPPSVNPAGFQTETLPKREPNRRRPPLSSVFEQNYLETGAIGVENDTAIIEHLKKERAGEA